MKLIVVIFIFSIIILLEAEVSAFSQIDDIIFNSNECEDNPLQDGFKYAYSMDLLQFGSVKYSRISKMRKRLETLKKAHEDSPISTYYSYQIALCNNPSKLQKLNQIANNIYKFLTKSQGASTNSLISRGGSVLFSDSELGCGIYFVATSLQTNNRNTIKAYFDQQEEEMQEAALERERATKEREKELAKAARERERVLRAAAAEREKAAKEREKSLRIAAAEREKAAKEREKSLRDAAAEREKAAKEREKRQGKRGADIRWMRTWE